MELDACEVLAKEIAKEDIDMIFFDAKFIDKVGNTKEIQLSMESKTYKQMEFIDELFKTHNLCWSIWAKLIKREVYIKAFDCSNIDHLKLNVAEDVLLYYPMISVSKNIRYINKHFYNYCFNKDSISNVRNLSATRVMIDEHDLVLKLLKLTSKNNNFANMLYYAVSHQLRIARNNIMLEFKKDISCNHNKLMLLAKYFRLQRQYYQKTMRIKYELHKIKRLLKG